MNQNPHILVEPFCGMAGLSFFMMRSKPPISWMGNKFGYAHVIADILGLSRHNPPAAYVWGDVGPNVAALATLAGAGGDARDVAGWLMAASVSFKQTPSAGFNPGAAYPAPKTATSHGHLTPRCPETVAPQVEALPLPRAAEVAAIIRGWKDEEPRALWTRLKKEGWPSLMPPKGARWGQPIVGRWLGPQSVEEVAGWLWVKGHENPYGNDLAPVYRTKERTPQAWGARPDWLARRCEQAPARFPRVACYQGTATRLVEQLPADLSGVLVYVDGPYHGDGSRKITGYKFGGCSRQEQLALAADCHRRGARVAMSESVPLAAELRALTGDEWWAVDITEHREGQARTFGGTPEYVTLNRPPAMVPGQQQGLFGGAR